jgi:hypothetical protein
MTGHGEPDPPDWSAMRTDARGFTSGAATAEAAPASLLEALEDGAVVAGGPGVLSRGSLPPLPEVAPGAGVSPRFAGEVVEVATFGGAWVAATVVGVVVVVAGGARAAGLMPGGAGVVPVVKDQPSTDPDGGVRLPAP